jgi:hypothetical protein
MPLTRDFKELMQRHVAEDPTFGAALLPEGITMILRAMWRREGSSAQLHQGDD